MYYPLGCMDHGKWLHIMNYAAPDKLTIDLFLNEMCWGVVLGDHNDMGAVMPQELVHALSMWKGGHGINTVKYQKHWVGL